MHVHLIYRLCKLTMQRTGAPRHVVTTLVGDIPALRIYVIPLHVYGKKIPVYHM